MPVQVFNVQEYRLKLFGAISGAEWFDATNVEAQNKRDLCNAKCVEDMVAFLRENPNGVAILDATNATHARRAYLVSEVQFRLDNSV